MVSFLKAMYGDAAKKQNDFAFHYLPKVDRNYSWTQIWDNMYRGSVKGMFAFGMNGVMIGPDTNKNIDALKKADWLVVGEIYPDETSEFWRAPGISTDEMKKINTTVYRLPCAGFAEKDGSMTNSARWLQWKNVACLRPAMRASIRISSRRFFCAFATSTERGRKIPRPDPESDLAVYRCRTSGARRSRQGNQRQGAGRSDRSGRRSKSSRRASSCRASRSSEDDGTTSCGNWIYSGSWTEAGPQLARRGTEDPSGLGIYPNWAWSWPANRRVLYNRASCDPAGKALGSRSDGRSGGTKMRKGGSATTFPTSNPIRTPKDHMGPFIMNPEGVGRIFGPLTSTRRRALSRNTTSRSKARIKESAAPESVE